MKLDLVDFRRRHRVDEKSALAREAKLRWAKAILAQSRATGWRFWLADFRVASAFRRWKLLEREAIHSNNRAHEEFAVVARASEIVEEAGKCRS